MTTIAQINEKIETLAKSERITKAMLSELSRDLLFYVLGDGQEVEATNDIQPVNRCLSVLTPMNKKTASLYFVAHLPFKFNEDNSTFGGMMKPKQVEGMVKNTFESLENLDFDIWLWAAANVKIEVKEIDWTAKLTSDMTKAIEAGLTGDDILKIMQTVLAADVEEELAEAA